MDSRVVIGYFLRNSLFLQAFHEGRDRCRIFGKSRLISSPYVLSMLCKTLESNKSLCVLERLRVALSRRDVFISPSVRYVVSSSAIPGEGVCY